MAEPIGALRVDVAANVAQIQDDLGKVKSIVNTASAQMSAGFGSFATSANKALTGIFNLRNAVALLATAGFVQLAKNSINAGDEIAKTAQKIGISTDALQELRYAANGAGVTTGDFDNALLQLSKRLGDTSGDITATQKALGQLGLSMADIKGKDTAQVVSMIADRISLVPDAMQRAKIATDLFGKSGQQLLPVLMSGSTGLAQMADQAHRLGLVISSETLKQAEQANDELTKIGTALKSAGVEMSVGFLPALQTLRGVVTSQDFQEGVKNLADNFGRLIKWMVDNKGTVEVIAAALAGMKFGAAFGPIGAGLGAAAGGLLAGANVASGIGDAQDLQKAIKSIEDELTILQSQQKYVGEQITNTPDGSIIGALATQSDALSARIAVLKSQLANLKGQNAQPTPTQVTVDVPKSITPFSPEVAKAIDDLSFKTRILNGDFNGLAEGFPELAHGLKQFGTSATDTATSVAGLSPQLQKLNQAMLQNDAAKVLQQTRPEADTQALQLQRLNQLYTAGALSAQQYARAVQSIQMPSQTRAIDDATNLNKAFDQFATNGLNSTADALTDVVTGAKSASEAFQALAVSVVHDLTEMIIKALLFRAVAAVFGFSQGGPVNFFADGGAVKMAGGGSIFGPGTGTSDSIPAMLSDGEYVVNSKAAGANMKLLDAINFGGFSMPHFASGGAVAAPAVNMAGSNDNGPAGMTILQSINNNFPPGMSGADRAYYNQKIDQSSESARRAAVQDVKRLNLRRTG